MELITKKGFSELQVKLRELREHTKIITERIKDAISDSPELSENKEYIEALEDQRRLDLNIINLEEKISTIRVIDINDYTDNLKNVSRFGCTVTIIDCETNQKATYQIVGVDEIGKLDNECLKISYKSPVGEALLKKEVGDIADIMTPSGERELEILEIKYI